MKTCWQSSVMYMQGLFEKQKVVSSNNPMLITVVLLLFKLDNKERALGRG